MTHPSTTLPDRSVPWVSTDAANLMSCERCSTTRELEPWQGIRALLAEQRRFVEQHRHCRRKEWRR